LENVSENTIASFASLEIEFNGKKIRKRKKL
jgi:hypothetical protein